MIYTFCRSVLLFIYKIMYRMEAVGVEHVPKSGGVLLCANHISLLDPPTIGIFLKRKVHFMAKKELFDIVGFSWLIKQLGAFPVKRGGVSKESIKMSLTLLREGHVMGIFPEGTRLKDGQSAIGKKGAATFALRSGAAVVPVAIIGHYKAFKKMKVVYGAPLDLSAYVDDKSTEAAEHVTEMIMTRIRELKDSNDK